VQKLLKTNGNKFVIAIGHGDLASVQALTGQSESEAGEPRVGMSEEDQLVGRAKAPASRRFFNFGGGDDEAAEVSLGKSSVGKEDRALLQEALYDLLECKRLLDQVR
jgi:hypothetical protein